MEVLTDFRVVAVTIVASGGTMEFSINGQRRAFPVQVYNKGLRAFDFPEELRVVLRQHPQASHRLMELLARLAENAAVELPVNLLQPDALHERRAA